MLFRPASKHLIQIIGEFQDHVFVCMHESKLFLDQENPFKVTISASNFLFSTTVPDLKFSNLPQRTSNKRMLDVRKRIPFFGTDRKSRKFKTAQQTGQRQQQYAKSVENCHESGSVKGRNIEGKRKCKIDLEEW